MIRVGSKEFDKLSVERKIALLIRRGYKQAAFRIKANANKFAAGWKRKGYKARGLRSSGPVVEGGHRTDAGKAYYVIVSKR